MGLWKKCKSPIPPFGFLLWTSLAQWSLIIWHPMIHCSFRSEDPKLLVSIAHMVGESTQKSLVDITPSIIISLQSGQCSILRYRRIESTSTRGPHSGCIFFRGNPFFPGVGEPKKSFLVLQENQETTPQKKTRRVLHSPPGNSPGRSRRNAAQLPRPPVAFGKLIGKNGKPLSE